MILALSENKFKPETPIMDSISVLSWPWQEYERRKIEIIKQARNHAEYEELNRKLLDELGL